jgi:hypothetical protein
MQFMRHLIVLLPIVPRTIVAIPKLVNLTDSQRIEIADELTAFDIDYADPVEFSPARRLVCCAVRFASGWSGVPSRIRGDRIGSSTVPVVDRHVARCCECNLGQSAWLVRRLIREAACRLRRKSVLQHACEGVATTGELGVARCIVGKVGVVVDQGVVELRRCRR